MGWWIEIKFWGMVILVGLGMLAMAIPVMAFILGLAALLAVFVLLLIPLALVCGLVVDVTGHKV